MKGVFVGVVVGSQDDRNLPLVVLDWIDEKVKKAERSSKVLIHSVIICAMNITAVC